MVLLNTGLGQQRSPQVVDQISSGYGDVCGLLKVPLFSALLFWVQSDMQQQQQLQEDTCSAKAAVLEGLLCIPHCLGPMW